MRNSKIYYSDLKSNKLKAREVNSKLTAVVQGSVNTLFRW